MLTHDIADIVPTLDGMGQLTRIVFTAVSSYGANCSASETLDAAGGFPPPAAGYVMADLDDGTVQPTAQLAAYTSEEILALCRATADRRGTFVHLDARAIGAATPVYQPSRIEPVELSDLQKKTIWMGLVDNNVAVVTERFTRFQVEYEQREKAAAAYKAAGYNGDPTEWITRYADNVGISHKAAADLILSQSAQLRGALLQLGNLRMDKYRIERAASIEDAQAEFETILGAVAAIDRSLA